MNKLASLRKAVNDTNFELAQNPDRLLVFATKGKAVATGATSLSFEYHYDAKIIVVDYERHPDSLIIPLLAWIRKEQPELMTNHEKRENGLRFDVDISANDLYDIEITIPVTERVRVWAEEGGLGCEHLPEPKEDPYSGFEWTLYINGEHQPWPPALVSEGPST
ncbi:phage tail protein [Aeromonas caviae]|uniref:phage tail protein n=1 Tax=Aeromonas caviae TaxID=648 RepID=UPI0029DAF32F|nr:phage tail protein [Aeromonas caviae]MDX7693625.1 phage tail protein [Aeromonas caviae]